MRREARSPKILVSGNWLFQSSMSWCWPKGTWALGTRLMIVWLHVYSFIAKIVVTSQTELRGSAWGWVKFTRKPGASSCVTRMRLTASRLPNNLDLWCFSVVVFNNLQGNWFVKLLFQQPFSVFLQKSGQMFSGSVHRRTIIKAGFFKPVSM